MERKSLRSPLGALGGEEKAVRRPYKAEVDDKEIESINNGPIGGGSHASQPPPEDKDQDEADEEVLDLKVEREWKNLLAAGTGESTIASNPKAKTIARGFIINWMNMRDAASGRIMWESDNWGADIFTREKTASIPRAILRCRAVSREINFTSAEMMDNFRLEQRVFFHGSCIEEWLFQFGFVIPGSTNSWQQIIEAADPDKMLPAEQLSGNLKIETSFYDGDMFLGKTVVRVLYV